VVPLKAGEAVVYMTTGNGVLVLGTTNSVVITNYTANTVMNYSVQFTLQQALIGKYGVLLIVH